MRILGISCFYHDAAAALLVDGQLVAAAEEERFSRIKHDSRWPQQAIDFCLATAGLHPDDLDCVVFYEKPLLKFERVLLSAVAAAPRSLRYFREAMISSLLDRLWVKAKLRGRFGLPGKRLLFCEHHLSHAASAFYCSPFTAAAVLTVDGVGEWTTATLGVGEGTTLRLTDELRFPHSLGLLYSAFTAWLGFEVNEGEYKVMGLAAYGRPKYVDRIHKVVQVDRDGGLHLDMSYFSFHQSVQHTYSPKFVALFGPPRDPRQERVEQYYADVAASIQRVCEETMLAMARQLHDRTGLPNLCLAGGVALNGVANGRIAREGPFERVFIQPAAGDSGGALGAALWAQHAVFGRPRTFVMDHAHWGQGYSPGEIRAAIDAAGVAYRDLGTPRRCNVRLSSGWSKARYSVGSRGGSSMDRVPSAHAPSSPIRGRWRSKTASIARSSSASRSGPLHRPFPCPPPAGTSTWRSRKPLTRHDSCCTSWTCWPDSARGCRRSPTLTALLDRRRWMQRSIPATPA